MVKEERMNSTTVDRSDTPLLGTIVITDESSSVLSCLEVQDKAAVQDAGYQWLLLSKHLLE